MRLFLALDLPAGPRSDLARLAAGIEGLPGWRWVRPEGWHVTLRFLGEVAAEAVAAAAPAWERAASMAEPFSVRLAGLGCFPPRGAPRILWAGVEETGGGGELARLAREVELAARGLGLGAEPDRPFRAHVTLGRARPGARPARPGEIGLVDGVAGRVEHLGLYESRLDPRGARYTALLRFALGRRGGG